MWQDTGLWRLCLLLTGVVFTHPAPHQVWQEEFLLRMGPAARSAVCPSSHHTSQQVSPVAFGILRLGECKEAQELWTLSHFYLQSTIENLFCFAFLLPGELREHFAKFGHIKRCSVPFVSIKIITKTIAGWDGGISVVEHCLVCMRLWVWSQTSRWKNYHLILVFFYQHIKYII